MFPKTIKISLDKGVKPPVRAHRTDAGLDLLSPVDVIVPARSAVVIDTGVHVAIPVGYVGFLKSKSGLMCHHGIVTEGVIDAGYTGSIHVRMLNTSDTPFPVHVGNRITQLVILPVIVPEIEIVDALDETERGDRGFGSSGR